MSPEHAKVLIAEDDPLILRSLRDYLSKAGHEVVGEGSTRAEAMAMISQIPALARQFGEEKIVVILGGSLGELRRAKDPNNDSQVLLRWLLDMGLGQIRTVGFSGLSVPGTTVDVGKENRPSALADAVTKV